LNCDQSFVLAHRSGDLFARYSDCFHGVVADTPLLVRAAQSLRYQVYCLERRFEEPAQHVDGLERDEDDIRSVAGLLYFKHDPDPIGTARLILPGRESDGLPVQRLLTKNGVRTAERAPNLTTAEVSRFSISKAFRKRAATALDLSALQPGQIAELYTALPCLGLVQTMLRASVTEGITHWLAIMEPKLLRMLATLGIHFQSIGPLLSFHGLRQPSICRLADMLERLAYEKPEHWNIVTDCGRLLPDGDYAQRSAA
jgi:N-acyl amino acid synthase of PEP-CTERM/exosortase system